MRTLRINSSNFSEAVSEAVVVLRAGGVVAHPTDTVWGLACGAVNAKAVRRIHSLKKSDPTKPLLINLPSKSYLNEIGSKLCRAHTLAKEFWPGGLSMLICSKDGKEKIGVRFPDHLLSNSLARKFKKPLITTSANITGKKVAKNAGEVAKIFPKIDLILDDGSSSKNAPSTLIDVSKKEVQCIREGTLPFKKILQKLSLRS